MSNSNPAASERSATIARFDELPQVGQSQLPTTKGSLTRGEIHEVVLVPTPSAQELDNPERIIVPGEPAPGLHARFRLFLWTFLLPVAIAGLYLFVIASDRYVSEVQFIVRSAGGRVAGAAAGAASAGGEGASIARGMTRATDESFIVNQYVVSRDALDWLIRHEDIGAVFNRPAADFLNRFPNFYTRNTRDSLYQYYTHMVEGEVDGSTGINSIAVQAFTPGDAQKVATGLLHSAEALVNRLNERQIKDALRLAQAEVDEAKRRVADVEMRLATYRDRSGLIDPTGETSSAFETLTLLSTELAQTEAAINQLKALTPKNPAIASLTDKAKSYRAEISQRKLALVGQNGSLAQKMAEYDQLTLERTIAAKAVTTAEVNLQSARHSVEQKQLYLETISAPNLPDQSKYPRRTLYLLATVLVAAIVFVTLRTLRQFAVEHAL